MCCSYWGVYATGTWAADGRVYTGEASTAPEGVFTTEKGPVLHLDVSGQPYSLCCSGTYLHYRCLCCTWTCLDNKKTLLVWTCLHHRGLGYTWNCLDNRSLCCMHLDVSLLQRLLLPWTCLHCRWLWSTWTCLLSTSQGPKLHLDPHLYNFWKYSIEHLKC